MEWDESRNLLDYDVRVEIVAPERLCVPWVVVHDDELRMLWLLVRDDEALVEARQGIVTRAANRARQLLVLAPSAVAPWMAPPFPGLLGAVTHIG